MKSRPLIIKKTKKPTKGVYSYTVNSIRKLDIFGNEFLLRIENKSNFKTIFGSILSILCLCFFAFGVFHTVKLLLDTSDPISTISKDRLRHSEMLDLYKNGHVPGFAIMVRKGNGIQFMSNVDIWKYITPVVRVVTSIRIEDPYGQKSDKYFDEVKEIPIEVTRCTEVAPTEITEKVRDDPIAKSLYDNSGLCVNFEDKSVWKV